MKRSRVSAPVGGWSAKRPRPSKAPWTKGSSRLRRLIGMADAKYHDVAAASYACDTTGSITHLDVVPQGDSVNNRTGKAWLNTSLNIRGTVTSNAATTATVAAIYIVWDKQPNKALPAITDVLDSVSSLSFTKRENAQRFTIVRKLRYSLEGDTGSLSNQTRSTQFDVDEYVRLPRDAVALATTSDTTGAIGNRITGALYAITVGNVTAGTTASTAALSYRLNIKDI